LKQQDYNEALFFSYLLGESSEAEEERLEQRYLNDEEFFNQLLTAEDELIDKYARHELSTQQRERFENYFMRSPERRERVGFAQAWAVFVSKSSKNPASIGPEAMSKPLISFRPFRSSLFWAPLAATAMLLVVGAFLVVDLARLRSEFEQVSAKYAALEASQQELKQQIEEQNEKLAKQLNDRSQPDGQGPNNADQQQTVPTIASLILTPGMVRGSGESKNLVIPSKASRVSLEINFRQGEYDTYQTVLKTVDGDEVARRTGLKAKPGKAGKAVVWGLPAGRFNEGDYILILSGVASSGEVEDIANYAFTVVKR
jgi:hypothetical protein